MALPIRPNSNNALPLPKVPVEALPELPDALPEITLPEPELSTPKAPRKKTQNTAESTSSPAQKRAPEKSIPEGWEIDAETGKAFKPLPGYKNGVMKHSAKLIKAGGMTLDQLRSAIVLDPDLDPDNLNGAAETFLSHLRVPPNKEEQERLRQERAKRQAAFDAADARNADDDNSE